MKKLNLYFLFSLVLITVSCDADKNPKLKENIQETGQSTTPKTNRTNQIYSRLGE
ncbi:MAG: hypothetical protein ACJA1A_002673 [Saprospiraceae bacterium]|jgi:hypothetical protein